MALTEIFKIQKFPTLNSCNQHVAKIYVSFVVRVTQLAIATSLPRAIASRLSSRLIIARRCNFRFEFWTERTCCKPLLFSSS